MKINDLKKEIEQVIEHQKEFAKLSLSDNTQTRNAGLQAEERQMIMQAVLDRINGDRIALSFYR